MGNNTDPQVATANLGRRDIQLGVNWESMFLQTKARTIVTNMKQGIEENDDFRGLRI